MVKGVAVDVGGSVADVGGMPWCWHYVGVGVGVGIRLVLLCDSRFFLLFSFFPSH